MRRERRRPQNNPFLSSALQERLEHVVLLELTADGYVVVVWISSKYEHVTCAQYLTFGFIITYKCIVNYSYHIVEGNTIR